MTPLPTRVEPRDPVDRGRVGSAPSALATALASAARRCAAGADRIDVLYSGGVDSSLVAHLLKALLPVRLLVIGTETSRDLASARRGARLLGLPLREETVRRDDLVGALRRFPDELEPLREPLRSVDLALAIAFARVEGPRVALGQGADELFYGYAHFRGLSAPEARRRSIEDWTRLEGQEWPRALRLAGAFGLEPVSPYLDPAVVREASALPPPAETDPPKVFLRRAALELGLPRELAEAPKRALQFGSGVQRLARSLRRDPDPLPHAAKPG